VDSPFVLPGVELGPLAPAVDGVVRAASTLVTPVHEMLYGLCDSMEARFLVGGVPVIHSRVLSPSALLPALAWMSQDAGQRLLEADFGCLLRKPADGEVTPLGAHCVVPPVTGHIADVTRALFFAHFAVELFGLRQGALVEVLPLQEMLRPIFESHLGSFNAQGDVTWPQMSPAI